MARGFYFKSIWLKIKSYCLYPLATRGPFLEAPGNYRARQAVLFSIPNESFKRFENCTVKLSAKETKWTSLEVRTHPTFLDTLISKYDFQPIKLPGLSRNRPRSCEILVTR